MKTKLALLILVISCTTIAQTNPIITSWLQNTTTFGSYYNSKSTTIPYPLTAMTALANCQKVQYDASYVYVTTRGIPTYPTGIFTGDGNTNLAGDQNAMYRFPLNPTKNTGTPTPTSGGNCGVFINGVSLFDYRDGVSWKNSTSSLCGGPGYRTCTGDGLWNRDAIPAEKKGFDCAKGHPAGTNYHHHQNPSAFKYDSTSSISYSDICNTYNSDALYTIDKTKHAPLIGFAYDGFPIYGAYAYKNRDGTGEITRMKSSYALNNTATTRSNGPAINQVFGTGATAQTMFNGYFREDYVYTSNPATDYLDEHNGRICNTPEYPKSLYPDGMYCYFATVDEYNTSVYPYVIGPTFYGTVVASKFGTSTTSVSGTTTYTPTLASLDFELESTTVTIYPNPAQDYISIQTNLTKNDLKIELLNELGQTIKKNEILQGSTLAFFETETLYNGIYFIKIDNGSHPKTYKVIIEK